MFNSKVKFSDFLKAKWDENNRGIRATNKLKSIGWSIFRALLLIGVSFIIVYPVLFMISVSVRTNADLSDPSIVWIPKHITFQPIIDAFKAMQYPTSVRNTLLICVVSSVLQVASCSLVGYGFARFKFKGRGLLFALVIFTIMVPPQVVYTPTYLMYRNFDFFGITSLIGLITGETLTVNLLDSVWTMYLPAVFGVGIRAGLFIYIFRQFYRGLPKELEDAAYIDGCGFVRTFLRVIIPNSRSSFLTVFLISTVWYWNDYYYTSMYFNFTKVKTLSTALSLIHSLLAGLNPEMNALMQDAYLQSSRVQAGALIVILPVLIMYICLQRYFTEGLERTGLVG